MDSLDSNPFETEVSPVPSTVRKFRRLKLSEKTDNSSVLSPESSISAQFDSLQASDSIKRQDSNLSTTEESGSRRRMTRSMSRKTDDEDSMQSTSVKKSRTLDFESLDEADEDEEWEQQEEETKEKKKRKKVAGTRKNSKKMDEESMPPPKLGKKSSSKKEGSQSENKKLKDKLKEQQIEDVSLYLFNYLRDVQSNTINKASLKRNFRGLMIDNITEEQADSMLNYPNLDAKEMTKDSMTLEDLKILVRTCNFKFDADGNLA